MRRLAIFGGFICSMGIFVWHLLRGDDVLHCSLMALIVLMTSTIIFTIMMKSIGNVLIDYLKEQKEELKTMNENDQDKSS